jgi:hypothetical protein
MGNDCNHEWVLVGCPTYICLDPENCPDPCRYRCTVCDMVKEGDRQWFTRLMGRLDHISENRVVDSRGKIDVGDFQ